jgi:membrane-associated phospholipid phosphatase
LIWLYFLLLIFEGTFRKWILPQYSDVLLIIRDPVAIAIYVLALKARIFPRNVYILSLGIIAFLSGLVSLLVLEPYLAVKPLVLVTGYGFRSNFLHLPLIFVIGKVMDEDDVKKLGWWILLGLIPMCVLLAVQFNSAPDAWVNRTAGLGDTQQITAGAGKIRPAGPFSFVSGVVFYAALSASYLLYASLSRGLYRNWLLYSAGLALVVTIGVSGSRSTLLAVLVVLSSLIALIFFRPSAVNQFARNLFIVVVVLFVASRLPVFNEGMQVLSDRFTGTAEAEETTIAGGLAFRMLSGFIEGFQLLTRAPIGGYGLGIGTNGGAKFLTGRTIFLLTEGEWGRVVLESGPILGFAFLAWRTILTLKIGLISIRTLKEGNILPIMLYAAGFLALLNGQFGQPTTLGFAVFLCGLCLAAANRKTTGPAASDHPPVRRVARRSRYAEQLHSLPGPRHPDDFVNR